MKIGIGIVSSLLFRAKYNGKLSLGSPGVLELREKKCKCDHQKQVLGIRNRLCVLCFFTRYTRIPNTKASMKHWNLAFSESTVVLWHGWLNTHWGHHARTFLQALHTLFPISCKYHPLLSYLVQLCWAKKVVGVVSIPR